MHIALRRPLRVSSSSTWYSFYTRGKHTKANIITVTPTMDHDEKPIGFRVRSYPNFELDGETSLRPQVESKSQNWPFLSSGDSLMHWMQKTIDTSSAILGESLKETPNMICVLEEISRRFPATLLASFVRFLLQPQAAGDLPSFSIHIIRSDQSSKESLSPDTVSEHIKRRLKAPQRAKIFLLTAPMTEKTVHISENGLLKQIVKYKVTSDDRKGPSMAFELRNIGGESISETYASVKEAIESIPEKEDGEKFVLLTAVSRETAMDVFDYSRTASSRIDIVPIDSIRCIFRDAGSNSALIRLVSESSDSTAFVQKLHNISTHFKAFASTRVKQVGELQKAADGLMPPKNRVICYASEKTLTFYHIQMNGAQNMAASVIAVTQADDRLEKWMSAISSPVIVFFNAARVVGKNANILRSDPVRKIMENVTLWCLSYGHLVVNGSLGESLHKTTLNEHMARNGIQIDAVSASDWQKSQLPVSSELMHVISINEFFTRQWTETQQNASCCRKMQQWTRNLFFHPPQPPSPDERSTIKLRQSLLRGYIPPAIPLDFQHHWRWFSPSHLARFFLGGSLKLGQDNMRERPSTSRSITHAIVEMAKNSSALHNVSETYLRQYARRRQIGLGVGSDAQSIVSSAIDSHGPVNSYRAVVYDMETTGLDIQHDRIIEIGVWDPVSAATYETFVNPETSIPASVTRIHGITDEDVASAPTWAGVAQSLVTFLTSLRGDSQSEILLIAHNSKKLDEHLLHRQFREVNVDFPNFVHCVDSLPIFFHCRRSLPETQLGTLRLGHLVDQFGIELDGTLHRAVTDAKSLWGVIEAVAIRYEKKQLSSSRLAEAQVEAQRKNIARWEAVRASPAKERSATDNTERRAIGHRSVLALMGHSIEENLVEKALGADTEEMTAIDHKTFAMTIQLPAIVNIGRILAEDTATEDREKIFYAIALMHLVETQVVPESARLYAIKEFLETIMKYVTPEERKEGALALLLGILELMGVKGSSNVYE